MARDPSIPSRLHRNSTRDKLRNMLESIFGSRTRVKLLKIFLSHPGEYLFVRELARMAEEKINSIRRELANLENVGLIVAENKIKMDEKKGTKEKRKYYTVNTDFILYHEFKNLILKSKLLLEKSLAKDIEKAGKIKLLVLSGVFVDDDKSQTDLLVVGSVDKNKFEKLVAKLEKNFEQEIRYTLMSSQEFGYRNKITDKFLFEVLDGKKIVVIDKLEK